MLSFALSSMVLSFIIGLVYIIIKKSVALPVVIVWAIQLVLLLGVNYVLLISKSMANILFLNLVLGLIIIPVGTVIEGKGKEKNSDVARMVFYIITTIGFGVVLVSFFMTHLNVKPMYNSLDITQQKEAPLFNSLTTTKKKDTKLADSITGSEQKEATSLDATKTPVAVAPSSVRNKMNKMMSVVPNTQYYSLGDLQIQQLKGKTVYVAPVEFTSFFSWLKGKETDGYFVMDATSNSAQPEFVKKKMKYTPSGMFANDAQRKIYNKYAQYVQVGAPQLEVDDNGQPFYVQTVYKTRGLTKQVNYKKIKAVVLNATTGESKIYDLKDVPEFVNGSISPKLASSMNEVFGNYSLGLWNNIFGKKNVKLPSDNGTENGVTPMFDANGDMFYFVDFTSPKSSSDSALGYSLINARTGELTFYGGKNNGIMDSDGALQIVSKEFPEKKWEGNMPILYNIDGNPTWVVSILDSNGLFKKYAYIKASDSDIAVYADTANQALEDYRNKLANIASDVASTDTSKLETITGKVIRSSLIVISKDTQVVKFMLEGYPTVFTVDATDFPKAVFLKEDDIAVFDANVTKDTKFANAINFDVTTLK